MKSRAVKKSREVGQSLEPCGGCFEGVLSMGRIESLPPEYSLVVGVHLSVFTGMSWPGSQPSSEKPEGEGREVVSRSE